jgi:sugar lactone lactonase YvrE
VDDKRKIEIVVRARNQLAEGPVWLEDRQELLWVDITRGLVQSWCPRRERTIATRFQGETSAVVPCAGGGLIVAVDHELVLLEADVGDSAIPTKTLVSVETNLPDNRFNDCRCDPQGRLWAGTMSKAREPHTAGLYRLSANREIELVVGDTTLSNGLAWSPDGQSMYFIDSTTQRIDVFDFDGGDGSLANRRCLAEIAAADGMPDGMTVDAEGGIWVCLFGGGALRRYSPDGRLDEHIALPVPHPTCPAFGGEDLSTIFLTTTRHRLTRQELADMPDAGSVFALRPGVAGLPANLYCR